MGAKKVLSRNFHSAMSLRNEPHKFIEAVSKLLGHYGQTLTEWAGCRTEAEVRAIVDQTLLAEGVTDEWQFLYAVSRISGIANKPGEIGLARFSSSATAGEDRGFGVLYDTTAQGHAETGIVKDIHYHIVGKAIERMVEDILLLILASMASHTRRAVLVIGPSRSGKTTILRKILEEIRKRSGVTGRDFREKGFPLIDKDDNALLYMDDCDLEVKTPEMEAAVEKELKRRKSPAVMVITGRHTRRMSSVIEGCGGKVFEIPPLTPDEMVDVVSRRTVGSAQLAIDTSRKVVSMLLAIKARNVLASAFDVASYLLYDESILNPFCSVVRSRDNQIRDAVFRVTGVEVRPRSRSAALKLRGRITRRVVGQEAVIDRVMPILTALSSGIADPSKPAGSMFLYGPSGVGKSYLGQVIADVLFDGKLHKEDMNTYTERHQVSRIIGAPPGYVGYDDIPPLMSFIDKYRRGVILLDEMEKANEVMSDFIMELLDTGYMNDAKGVIHDARGFLIIMTSNVKFGARKITGIGYDRDEQEDESDRKELLATGVFKKEFIGRIQLVCKYSNLDESIHRDVARIILAELSERLSRMGVRPKAFTEEHIEELVNQYDESMGARSMKIYAETVIKADLMNVNIREEQHVK